MTARAATAGGGAGPGRWAAVVDEVSDRIDDWLPSDLTARREIERAIEDSNFPNDWSPATLDAVADNVAGRRDPQTTVEAAAERRQTTILGGEDGRFATVRAADGTSLGKRENVTTWTDRWGNVMGENSETGTRKKVRDASEVDR